MPRPGGPWWRKDRSCWSTTIKGARYSAPREIGERDKAAAWAWYSALAAELSAPRADVRVADLFNLYLEACRARLARGDMDAESVRLAKVVLTKAAGFAVDGVKFGATPVGDVRLRHLESIIAQWGDRPGVRAGSKVSASYLSTASGIVRTAFRWATRPGGGSPPILAANPFVGFRPPSPRPAGVAICGRGDAARWLRWLRANADPGFTLLQRCLVATGARPSEFYRATWGEVRWEAGRMPSGAVYGTLVRAEWKNARKSGKARRIVLLPSVVRPLRRLFERTSPSPGDLIFRSATGKPWYPALLAHATRRAREAAVADGVKLPADTGRIRGYLWRHLAASRLVMQGVDLVTIGDLLGTSPAMIARTYAHLRDEHVVAAASALAAADRKPTTGRGGSAPRGGGRGA